MQFRDVKEGSTGFDANHPLNDATLEQFAIKNSIGQIISARFPRIIPRRIESLNNFSLFFRSRGKLFKMENQVDRFLRVSFIRIAFISSRLDSLPKSFNPVLLFFFFRNNFSIPSRSKWVETYIIIL